MAALVGKEMKQGFERLRSLLETLRPEPGSADVGEVLALVAELQDRVTSVCATCDEQERKRFQLEERIKDSESRIRASERSYRDLFNLADDSIFVHRFGGVFLDVNDSACRRLGYSRDELRAMTPADLTPPDLRDRVAERTRIMAEKGRLTFQTENQTKDGRRIPVEVNAKVVEYQGDKAILAISRDVTGRHEAAETLENQYHFVQTLMDAAPAPIFYKDLAGVYQGCNTAFAKFMGLSRDQIIGHTSEDIADKDLALLASRMDKELMEKGGTQIFESLVRPCAGGERHALFSKATFRNLNGDVIGLVGVILDITENKRAEAELKRSREDLEARVRERTIQLTEAYARLAESEQKHRTLYEQASEGILLVKEGGLVLDANPAALELFDCKLEDLLGSYLKEYLSHDSEIPLEEMLGALETDQTVRRELKLPQDGEERCVEASARRMEAGRLMVMLRDVTRRQRISRELMQARLAAEDANQAKSEFLANMSHEIRTPIGAILGITDMALAQKPGEALAGLLRKIRRAADGLLNIVNDVLDFSKIEARKLELKDEDFSLGEHLTRICEEFEHEARAKGLSLRCPEFEESLNVHGDRGRLEQVLSNLLSNAIKFTPEGEVVLSMGIESRDKDAMVLEFRVRDTGVGIAQDKRDQLFKTFTQLESSLVRGHSGTGLGLVICKRLVELMGGRIWLEDNQGPGACFCFTVRFAPAGKVLPPPDEEPLAPVVGKEGPGRRILLAEDNLLNQEFLSYFLNEAGHQVTVVSNGLEALLALSRENFDLVLMDVQMPGMDGLEAVRRIRRHDGSEYDPAIPVVALTAFAMKGDRERILAAGMNEYLSKPVEMAMLCDMITRLSGK